MATDHKLTKSVGEHFVCSALAQVGWAASLTRDGIARTDILAAQADPASGEVIQMQVKTSTTTSRPSWLLGNVKLAAAKNEWYVLVALGSSVLERPRCFLVPRDHVAAATWVSHYAWLRDPDVPSGRRNTPIERARIGADVWAGYEERWDLLAMESVPVLAPLWMRDTMNKDDVGLPPGHPWLTTPPSHWPGPPAAQNGKT